MEERCIVHGLNRYKTICEIGEGAFGIVFKCKDLLTNEIVALKEFKPCNLEYNENIHTYKNNSFKKLSKFTHNKILREIATLRRLCGQENIIQLRDFFLHENRYYLSLEYFPQTLLQYLENSPKGINIEIIKSCIYQLLLALKRCHSMGIIHRDVKPENVLIREDKISNHLELKLCDFGFARFIQHKSYCNQGLDNLKLLEHHNTPNRPLTSYVSTRWYRAPELLVRSTEYDTSIDIWAVGCIMAELIDGEPLFPGTSDVDQLYLIRNCIGRLDSKHQSILEKDKEFYSKYKKHIYKGFLSGSNSKYRLECSNEKNEVIPPYQIMSLKERYGKKIDSTSLDFLELLLSIDPSKRPTCEESLSHSFFHSILSKDKIEQFKFDSQKTLAPIRSSNCNSLPSKSLSSFEKTNLDTIGIRDCYERRNENTTNNNINSNQTEQLYTNHTSNVSNDEKTTAPSTPNDITPLSYGGKKQSITMRQDLVALPKFPNIIPPPPKLTSYVNCHKNVSNNEIKNQKKTMNFASLLLSNKSQN